jgi:hypothetical protein
MTAYDEKLAAAIAKAGIPLTADMVAPKPEQRLDLDAIVARALRIGRQYVMPDETDQDDLDRLTDFDVPQLVAEVRGLRIQAAKDRAQIANHQPVLAELNRLRAELDARKEQLTNRINAVLDICDREQRNAMRWENPIPVPDWVAPVQRAALGDDKRTEGAAS